MNPILIGGPVGAGCVVVAAAAAAAAAWDVDVTGAFFELDELHAAPTNTTDPSKASAASDVRTGLAS